MAGQLGYILIVDGDDKFAGDLAAGLRARMAEVEVVTSPEAMLESMTRRRPQMILLSVELPKSKGAGYLACNKLKKDPDLASIPVLLMSNTATEDDFAKHRKLTTRADDYIRKPFSDDEFFKRVGNILGFEISHGDFAQLQEKVHDFLGEKADLEAEIRQKAETIAQLEAQVAHLQHELADKRRSEADAIENEQRTIDALRSECKTIEDTIVRFKADVRSAEDLLGELTEQKAVLEAEIELLQGQQHEASAAVEQAQTAAQAIANEIKELELGRARLTEVISAAKRQFTRLAQVAREAADSVESAAAGL